jgi:Holliday junction resolvase RusA-like endonuclease
MGRSASGRPRWYTPTASVDYQRRIRELACLARCPLFAKGCRVELLIVLPDNRVRDRDNILKGVLDALQGNARLKRRPIAWINDHDIGDVSYKWHVDSTNPRIELTIEGRHASAKQSAPLLT